VKNPKKPAYQLTSDDAVEIWLRHFRGEYQHHIAAHFSVNPGRVSEILKERKHLGSKSAALSQLKSR
jgi:hypothetical protein